MMKKVLAILFPVFLFAGGYGQFIATFGGGPSSQGNRVPYLTHVYIAGQTYIDSTLTANYTYNDYEGDVMDSVHVDWYNRYGTLVQSSGDTYVLVVADSGYYPHIVATPYAATGTSPGDGVQSDSVGPVTRAPWAYPTYFADGIIWVEGTDTTQIDS
ncbi:MAG: hypothetical protein KKD77_20120, partial [Gammaproteobacteria bacterium]|nr:hypothetical protein [Gammaproteobacteria bacterium]